MIIQVWVLLIQCSIVNQSALNKTRTSCSNRSCTEPYSLTELETLRNRTINLFKHTYNSYMSYAFPADELKPLSCEGRYRMGNERGDIDDILGNFSLTLIDSLDTLAVLGLHDEFETAVKHVISNVSFDLNVTVSFFETNIRLVGGLLGAHVAALQLKKNGQMIWYEGELLIKAGDLSERLALAFDTPTGLPLSRINLKFGIDSSSSRVTCVACAGTLLELIVVSRLLRKDHITEKATKAMDFLWINRNHSTDLVGTTINVDNGDWSEPYACAGAGADSYYEYLLKSYIVLGNSTYIHRFQKHLNAMSNYLTNDGMRYRTVDMNAPWITKRTFIDSLIAYLPAAQILAGNTEPAIYLYEFLYKISEMHVFLPEAFTADGQIYWPDHLLRPELIESAYALFEATKDPYYRCNGERFLENIENFAKVECGIAAINDVRTMKLQDRLDSFVLAETFKYLYFLFGGASSGSMVNMNDYMLSTEAHLMPILSRPFVDRQMTNTSEFISLKLNSSALPSIRDLVRNETFSSHEQPSWSKQYERITISWTSSDSISIQSAIPASLLASLLSAERIAGEEIANHRLYAMRPIDQHQSFPTAIGVSLAEFVQPSVKPVLGQVVNASEMLDFGCTGAKKFYKNKIVLLSRGYCDFSQKAFNVESGSGIGAIVVDYPNNKEETIMVGNGRNVGIPFALITHERSNLLNALMKGPDAIVYLGPAKNLIECIHEHYVNKSPPLRLHNSFFMSDDQCPTSATLLECIGREYALGNSRIIIFKNGFGTFFGAADGDEPLNFILLRNNTVLFSADSRNLQNLAEFNATFECSPKINHCHRSHMLKLDECTKVLRVVTDIRYLISKSYQGQTSPVIFASILM